MNESGGLRRTAGSFAFFVLVFGIVITCSITTFTPRVRIIATIATVSVVSI